MPETLARVLVVGLSFSIGLILSTAAYRLCLHRLRNFPGPIGAKLSRFYATALAAKNIQYHLDVKEMHEKYGDFVKTRK